MKYFKIFSLLCIGCCALWIQPVLAAKIGEIDSVQLIEHVKRFWRFEDPAVRNAVLGSILMGVCCGLLGSFLVVRKLSLVGDTLSHAVLPGVALAFMWSGTKDPFLIFIGAVGAGLIGTVLVQLIQSTTVLKSDSALGMVLSGFYALGISLFTIIQKYPQGNKSGLNSFLFGQAAAIAEADLVLMSIVTLLALSIIGIFYKELLVSSFDESYAQSLGIAVAFFHYLLIVLLSFAVVISLQATGVALVSAMLITPAATAYLLTDRFHRLIGYAAALGVLSGVVGCFISFLGNNFPTGPFMVIASSLVFTIAFLFAPKYGVFIKWWKARCLREKVRIENVLKAIYHILEEIQFKDQAVSVEQISKKMKIPQEHMQKLLQELISRQLVTWVYRSKKTTEVNQSENVEKQTKLSLQTKMLLLTPIGWDRACEIVRNHRLWELYLTNEAHYPLDHVHEDAEKIEHILGENIVREIERKLNYPRLDPHGKPIPSLKDMARNSTFKKNISQNNIEGFKQPFN